MFKLANDFIFVHKIMKRWTVLIFVVKIRKKSTFQFFSRRCLANFEIKPSKFHLPEGFTNSVLDWLSSDLSTWSIKKCCHTRPSLIRRAVRHDEVIQEGRSLVLDYRYHSTGDGVVAPLSRCCPLTDFIQSFSTKLLFIVSCDDPQCSIMCSI